MRNPELSYYNGPIYQDLPTYTEPSTQRGRVFLVAVHGEQMQTFGRGNFDRVHVMVVDPNQMANVSHPLSVLCALPDVRAGISPAVPPRDLLAVKSRPVCGEILRNQEGQFYERRGKQLVLLRNLVSGPRGEIIEFLPPAKRRSSGYNSADGPEFIEIDESQPDAEETPEPFRPDHESFRSAVRQQGRAVRKLFPDPGQLRLLNFGDFSASLAPQLKNPERLREIHQLPCYLQVFEIRQLVSFQDMAASLREDPSYLLRMTPVLAQKLGLTQLIPALKHTSPLTRPVLVPGEMVCCLHVVRDPTAELATASADSHVPRDDNPNLQAPSGTSSRKSIPSSYLKPWEFKLSREEVVYEMNRAQARKGWFRRAIAFFRERVRRSDFERWTSLLANKNADEQLWAIRPPKNSLNKAQIRGWASQALALAGYDTQTMLAEWEIYWRRKGLN